MQESGVAKENRLRRIMKEDATDDELLLVSAIISTRLE
jgi:hypothetical protein